MAKRKYDWFSTCVFRFGLDAIPKRSAKEIVIPVLGALLAQIAVVAVSAAVLSGHDVPILVASMGAAGVLLFAAPRSPLVQPYPLVMGHFVSVMVGVTCAEYVPNHMLAGALAVAGAIFMMLLTRSLHPPGGAAAISAVIGGESVRSLGYWFVLTPVMLNVLILLLSAIVVNRMLGQEYPRRYQAADDDISRATDDLDQNAG